jgi:hypothetical protein
MMNNHASVHVGKGFMGHWNIMNRQTNPNIEILEQTVQLLDELNDKFVFLGGCAIGLLLTDPAAPPVRYTQDVDVKSRKLRL